MPTEDYLSFESRLGVVLFLVVVAALILGVTDIPGMDHLLTAGRWSLVLGIMALAFMFLSQGDLWLRDKFLGRGPKFGLKIRFPRFRR